MRVLKIAAAALTFAAIAAPVSFAQTASPRVFSPDGEPDAPPIDVWLDQVNYDAGSNIRPHFQTEPGAYVTIVRVTTDGQLRVMYPSKPGRQSPEPFRQANDTRVPFNGYPGFSVSESSGTGFIFAIASYHKFDYEHFSWGGQWNNARLASAGRYGDPFEIVRMFIDETLDDAADFSMDFATYEVFSRDKRSRYATRYHYASYDDYYDRCNSAFGYGYSSYCQNYGYYNGFYGVVVGVAPRTPPRRVANEPRIKPLVPDPMLPHHDGPEEPEIAQNRRAGGGEGYVYTRRERMGREAMPRAETGPVGRVQGASDESRAMERRRMEPRSEPRVYREPAMPSFPRIDAPRAEPRSQPQAPARVEVRNEPRVERIQRAEPRIERIQHAEPRVERIQHPEPRPAPTPIERDGRN